MIEAENKIFEDARLEMIKEENQLLMNQKLNEDNEANEENGNEIDNNENEKEKNEDNAKLDKNLFIDNGGERVYSMAYTTAVIYGEKTGRQIDMPPASSLGRFYVSYSALPGGFYDGYSFADQAVQ